MRGDEEDQGEEVEVEVEEFARRLEGMMCCWDGEVKKLCELGRGGWLAARSLPEFARSGSRKRCLRSKSSSSGRG